MADAKHATFIMKLVKDTSSAKVVWRESGKANIYEASYEGDVIKLRHRVISQSIDDYTLSIFEEDGRLKEKISDTDFARPEPANEMYKTMKDLYNKAGRSASGPSDTMESIMDKFRNR